MTAPLSNIISVSIALGIVSLSQTGFGTPLVAGYHTKNTDIVRTYSSITELEDDGFRSFEPIHRAATAIFAQQPTVTSIKVGRRQQEWTQVVDLTPATPSDGLIYKVTINDHDVSYTADSDDTLADVCTALAVAINAATDADDDAIVSGTSTGGIQTITNLTGVIGDDEMTPSRALTLTLSNHANWDATTAVVTGTNDAGDTITENFSIPDGGNAVLNGSKLFASVTQIVIPAQSGTSGTWKLGVRGRLSANGGSGTKVVVTATTAATMQEYSSLENLSFKDATSDPGIADDLSDIVAVDDDWYGLLLDSNSQAEVAAAAAWVEARRKIFAYHTADTKCGDSTSTTDVMAVLNAAGYVRTAGLMLTSLGIDWASAAWMGDRLPSEAGSDTWALKTLAGVTAANLGTSARSAVLTKKGNTYEVYGTSGNPAYTNKGTAAGGRFMDLTRGMDWFVTTIEERVFAFIVAASADKKLPYTDKSVERVKAEILAVCDEAVKRDFLAETPKTTCTAPLVKNVSTVDKAARKLPNVKVSGPLAGAIHTIEITGTLVL